MAFAHQPLTPEQLGPAAAKVVDPGAPGPLRGMAAKGLAPLPPRDLLVALYQFWVTNEAPLAEDAGKTVVGLPPGVLAGALGDAHLPPGVLDFLARKSATNVDVLERVVRHPAVSEETLVSVGRLCPEEICDILAENQQRWLQCPAIVEALYHNPNARMSVVHRMLELAVREGLELKLPNLEEIKAALGESGGAAPERDDAFRRAAAGNVAGGHARMVARVQQAAVGEEVHASDAAEETDSSLVLDALLGTEAPDELSLPMDEAPTEAADEEPERKVMDPVTRISKLMPMEKIRLAMLGSTFERAILVRDRNKSVALSAIKSPRVKENEAVSYAANRTLSHDVIRYIARRREWTKLYAVKLNLVLNPKTPMSTAMTFLSHLHASDVKKVAHSKNIPSALAQAAKRKMSQRR